MNENTRSLISEAVQNSQLSRARSLCTGLLNEKPSLGNARFIISQLSGAQEQPGPTLKVAFLRSFTLEPMLPLLTARALTLGLHIETWIGGFNLYTQDILNEESALYAFNPDVVVLALQSRDVAPSLWKAFSGLDADERRGAFESVLGQYQALIEQFRARSEARLVIHNLDLPSWPSMGVIDAQPQITAQSSDATTGSTEGLGQLDIFRRLNESLRELAQQYNGVHILDLEGLIARHGRANWYDERKWLLARMPIASACLMPLADEHVRLFVPFAGLTRKVLVLDLDNTLWGGVLGEDGPDGIKLGIEYPGAAFQSFQRAALDLYHRGVILAICSKNNLGDVMPVLENHPGMLIRPKHLSCLRINWIDKAQNLLDIAAELNVGINSLVFFDDNPFERERVRGELPGVHVIEAPEDPMAYAEALRRCPLFEKVHLAEEDRKRGQYYAANFQRQTLRKSMGSLTEFYHSLQMSVEFADASPATLPRTAQLTQKTNQFNTTTLRFSEQDIASFSSSPAHRVLTMKAFDRFGESGLVGVAILQRQGEACEIDLLLMSCRVIGRTLEVAFLNHAAKVAREEGARRLNGWIRETPKNVPVRKLYQEFGFEEADRDGSGVYWTLNLDEHKLTTPPWIEVREHHS